MKFFFQKAKDIQVWRKGAKPTPRQLAAKKAIWLISTSRNALIVLLCSVLSYCLSDLSSEENGGSGARNATEPVFILTGNHYFFSDR